MPLNRSATHWLARRGLTFLVVAFGGLFASGARADIVRTFDFAPADARIVSSPDGAVVSLAGAVPDGRPGEPELPAMPVYVELEPGTRVRSFSVEGLGWVSLGAPAGHLRTAAAVSPGFPRVTSPPDPSLYGSEAWFPGATGTLGPVGSMRGRVLASFVLRPVRARPATGVLEMATRVVVRVVTEADPNPDVLVRKRVVPEWEQQFSGMKRQYGRGFDELAAPTQFPGARIQHASGLEPTSQGGGFAPSSVPSVEGSPVQYLIITNNAMASQLQRLADWHTRAGMPTVVRTIEFIASTYPYGVDLQDRVRRFIRDAYQQWGITHVLLAGDTDIIPPRYAYTTFFGGNYIPAELYFSDLDGNWNADGDSLFGEGFQDSINTGDGVDLYPDVYVGRAPIVNASMAQTFVDKTLQYSETPVGDYENRALYAAEVLFPQDWNPSLGISVDGAGDAESAIHKLTPEMQPLRLYENYTAYDTLGAVRETRQAVLDSLTRGWGIMHHVGHGYRNSMSVGDAAITNPDADALQNGNRTWVLYSIDCTSNAIDFSCLGEAFVNNPHGGAVANVGSTREDFPITGRSYQDEWYDLVFQDTVPTIGQAFAQQKVPFVPLAGYDNTHRWTQFTLALLGDPAMPIWWRKPAPMTVTYPGTVPLSDTTFTVHVTDGVNPLPNATVCFDKSGEEYQVVLTDGSGNSVMRVRPETTGSASITVTHGGGFHPWEGTITVGAPTTAVLVSKAADRTVNDGTGGTIGNSDGGADAGETIDWLLPVTNSGSVAAGIVAAQLSTTDPRASILVGSVGYGSISPGTKSNGTPYRIHLDPNAPDGTEILFQLDLFSGPKHWVDSFRLPVRAPNLVVVSNTITDNGTSGTSGNGNGRFDVGETVNLVFNMRNTTGGAGHTLSATLSTTTPGITIPVPTATLGPEMPAGTNASTTAFRVVSSTGVNPSFLFTVNDAYGVRFSRRVDLLQPSGVSGVIGTGAASTITLVWAKSPNADVVGYNIYRGSTPAGPFSKVNVTPTDRSAYYVDEGLPGLSRFYYQVSAVDSSGNESAMSVVSSSSTNPPMKAGWPQPMGRTSPASPLIGNIDHSNDSSYEIMSGADVLWCWHADGTPLRDADGSARTSGDFTNEGSYYAAGATLADLNSDGVWEIIAPSWDTKQLFVFEPDATDYTGFPKQLYDNIWSSAAVGNIDATPQPEIVFASNGSNFYAFHSDGTEVMDGDNNPATTGVFKVLGSLYNYGSPALADLDGDGKLDIIYGSADGWLYAWKGDGTNVPGWPINLFAGTTCSPAVGDIDNDGILEVVITATNNKLYVFKANGTPQPGFPVTGVTATGASRCPSPALADMEGLGQKDIVINTTDGYLKVFRPNGTQLSQWTNVRYSVLTSLASETSPVVADIDGDGQNEVIIGDEHGDLSAFDNDGTLMGGFPIHLGGEVRGTPAVWDIDHDNLTEIVVSCWDKNVYVWDYPGVFSPNSAPPWAMWRHDQFRQGRLGAPIVVSAASVAFSAQVAARAGLELTFAMPATPEAEGRYDIYRAEGAGDVGTFAYALPSGFARINADPLDVSSGSLIKWTDASALAGHAYRYLFLRRQERPGDAFLAYGPFAATASSEAPEVAFVGQNFPNPAHGGRTTIAYGVPQSSGPVVRTTLQFFDVRGRVVRTLVDGLVPPGRYQVSWDGKDDRGATVAPGVYFYEFAAGPTRLTKKALFLGP